MREMKLAKGWELGAWVVEFLERSASTLTKLDLRCENLRHRARQTPRMPFRSDPMPPPLRSHSNNGLGPDGATALSAKVGGLTALQRLDLRCLESLGG